jgi:hypothetical protein
MGDRFLEWESHASGPYGGNEVRFQIQGSPMIRLTLAVDAWVWVHLFVNDDHQATIPPESQPSIVALPLDAGKDSEIRIVRTRGLFRAFLRGRSPG